MPNLSGLDSRLSRLLITAVLVGDPGVTPKEALYRRNFVRLNDKALNEYQAARLAQIKLIECGGSEFLAGGWEWFLRFIGHFENCINATSRLIRMIDRILGERGALAVPRTQRRLIEACSKSILEIRNAIEHMDEAIQRGEVTGDQPVMLNIGEPGDRATLGTFQVRFSDLAITLRRLNEIAKYMASV